MPVVNDLDTYLEPALEMLGPSVARTKSTSIEDVRSDIEERHCILWTVKVEDTLMAAFTTCVLHHPRRQTLLIEHMGGVDMKKWMRPALNVLKAVAKNGNLDAIEAEGRGGFARYAKSNGFEETHRHFEMEV